MKKQKKQVHWIMYLPLMVVLALCVYEYVYASTPSKIFTNETWIEVHGDDFETGEEAYEWVCEHYPETKSIRFSKWMKMVESENVTPSMLEDLFYTKDDIFDLVTVNLYVIDSQ